jgi:hypothetical protein
MKPPKIFKSLTPLVLAALLLSIAAPVSNAQRRRSRTRAHARTTQRTRSAAPRNVIIAQPRPAPSASQPAANADARTPANDSAVAPRAPDADEQRRAPESDSTLEEMVGADTYGAYVELRRLGTVAQTNELKTAVAGMKLIGDTETKPVTDLVGFVSENYELLAETRAVVLFMVARPRVPEALLALEFPTAQDAAVFEPKYRQFAEAQFKAYVSAKGPKDSTERHTPERARAQKPEVKKAAAPDYTIRRVGRLIISSEGTLSFKRLRGEESAPALADSTRFQSARTRFASDSLFVYVDTGVTIQGFTRLSQTEGSQDGAKQGTITMTRETTTGTAVTVAVPESSAVGVGSGPPPPTPEPTPEEISTSEVDAGEGGGEGAVASPSTIEIVKPSEEQAAVAGMDNVIRSLWGGMPRIPGAFALGARLDGGAIALRLAVENSPDGRINVLPFLPNFVAGPPVTAEAAEVAPADADVFFTTSLDWEQIYTSTVGAASLSPMLMTSIARNDDDEGDEGAEGAKPPKPEEAVAAVEKLFGF